MADLRKIPVTTSFCARAVDELTTVVALEIGVLLTKRAGHDFLLDLFVSDSVETDSAAWDALAAQLDNLSNFARREAHKRRK